MKSIFATVALMTLMTVSFAQANPASIFTGKYQAVYGFCKDFPRVYITLGPSPAGPKGATAVIINYYGMDARMDYVLLGAGKRQAPGTDPSIHGEVTEEWFTEIRGTSLVSKIRVTRPSIGLRYQTEFIMAMQDNVMTIAETVTSQDGKQARKMCNLVRSN